MILKTLTVGSMATNCYIIGCDKTRQAGIIDPGGNEDKIIDSVTRDNLDINFIINTHGHIDHILGNEHLRKTFSCPVYIHQKDSGCFTDSTLNLSTLLFLSPPHFSPADRELREGNEIELGTLSLYILHTPGHSEGSISIVADNEVFTGDALFYRGIGRTDLPGSNLQTLAESIQKKLFNLPDELTIRPGHGPPSTIGEEKKENPFVRPLKP